MSENAPKKKANKAIVIAISAFVGTCLLFLGAGILLAPYFSETGEGYPLQETALTQEDGSLLVTLATEDKEAWVPFSLELGMVVPDSDLADIYIRRYQFRAPRGALQIGKTPLEEAVLPETPVWKQDKTIDGALINKALEKWYTYDYMSHLLETKNRTYAVKLQSKEKTAFLKVLSYYCQPEGPGCMTINYRIQ